MMIVDFKKDNICFDPAQIEESGQCFRFIRIPEPILNSGDITGTYTTISGGRFLEIGCLSDGRFMFSCPPKEFDDFWRDYFDLKTDYEAFKSAVDPSDSFLSKAAAYGCGIRILRQDLWEMMISFIISQRKSIPAIRSCIESLCTAYGEPIHVADRVFYSFPTAERLAELDIEDLKPHGVGYRDKYILRLSRDVRDGIVNIDHYRTLTGDEAVSELTKIYGIGTKVANCISLFGLHNIDAFPEDVWIKRVIAEEYGGHFDKERYNGFAGVIQQYMFFYGKSKDYRR